MEACVRAIITEMAHYKHVNKRFTERIEEYGYHAYICKDQHSTKLHIYKQGIKDRNFTLYLSHWGPTIPQLTWERILQEFERYNYAGALEIAKDRLEFFDAEKRELEYLLQVVKSKKFRCFETYEAIRPLENALDNANKE
jgi:hypothetical protein